MKRRKMLIYGTVTQDCRVCQDGQRFFLPSVVRMTKQRFVIGKFISGWSHAAWVKLMPCGPLKNERANDSTNIE